MMTMKQVVLMTPMVLQLRSMALLLMMLMVLPQRPLVTMMTMKQVVLMTPMVLQLKNMVPLLMMLMVPQLRHMVLPQKDLLTMMTMLPEMFLLMLMLLLRLPLPMRMLDVAVPAEDLAALLPDLTEEKLSVVDVPGASERPTGAHLL